MSLPTPKPRPGPDPGPHQTSRAAPLIEVPGQARDAASATRRLHSLGAPLLTLLLATPLSALAHGIARPRTLPLTLQVKVHACVPGIDRRAFGASGAVGEHGPVLTRQVRVGARSAFPRVLKACLRGKPGFSVPLPAPRHPGQRSLDVHATLARTQAPMRKVR